MNDVLNDVLHDDEWERICLYAQKYEQYMRNGVE